MSAPTRRARTLLAVAGAMAAMLVAGPGLALAASQLRSRPRVSFSQVEDQLMCVACHESLAVANSPEAYSERQYVRDLIAQGLDERQILHQMAVVYTDAVLARPPARGFNLLLYVLPPALLALGLAVLVVVLPRWRRATRSREGPPGGGPAPAGAPALDAADARRLEEDLARHEA